VTESGVPNHSNPDPQRRTSTIIAAGLLLAALALIVLYTSRRAFLSPLALVVVAAIGVAALLLQIRLRPSLATPSQESSFRAPLWLNIAGVAFAVAAVSADILRPDSTLMLIAALAAVVAFAVSGIIVLRALRKRRV
jgi:hypothetical protein